MKKLSISFAFSMFVFQISLANIYYVSTTGNDASGDGSAGMPWRTLMYTVTRVAANQGHTIQLASGTFLENGLVEVPLGVNVIGAGIDQTILGAASSFYYNPATPGYATDKFLISLNEFNQLNGNQTLKGFTIDGGLKQLHGGIYVRHRNNVTIDGVKVQNTNFSGIWLWDVKDSKLINSQLINCSWGSSAYCSGALNLGNVERVEVDQLNVDENTGYGIKAIGPGGSNDVWNLKIHDSRISVNPFGIWNGGSAPNIAIELWQVNLIGNEIYNCYVDNTISLVNSNATPSTGVQTIRVHHNTIDMDTRARGAGYGVELTIHDAEVDHNYFIKGNYGIANWDNPMINWSIHHNTFYAIQGTYPGEVVRSQWSGLHNVKLYSNTIEFASDKTMNVVGLYGGTSDNIDIQNNLFMDNNTGYSYYPNQLIHLENNAVLTTLAVKNNLFSKLPVGSIPGTYQNNITTDPLINFAGLRTDPYYLPKAGSPLIDAGVNLGFSYLGSAPDIGAFEYAAVTNVVPQVSITSPVNNANFIAGATVTINATATDIDGTISKVEFYNGATLLGRSLTAPYSFVWNSVPAGTFTLSVSATDNIGATTASSSTTITVNTPALLQLGFDSSDAALSGQMTLGYDVTAAMGTYFSVPPGNGRNYYIPAPATATFNFNVPKADNFVIWAKVKSLADQSQGYYIYNGQGRWFTWLAGIHTNWAWVKITDAGVDALFSFGSGANNFQMAWFDENVQVDQIIITNDLSFTPLQDPVIASQLAVYPNPVIANYFTIKYTSPVSQQAQVSIFDNAATLVKQTMVNLNAGTNDVVVDTNYIYNGPYIVAFQPTNGQKSTARIIISR